MKRQRLPLLGPNTVIQAAIIPPFTCVLRWHTISSKVKDQNLIKYNSVAGEQIPACWLANPNIHQLLKPTQLPTTALPKRLSVIFLWAEFYQRDPIPIFNPLLKTVRICGGRWGAHSYLASPKNNKKCTTFIIGLLSLF